MSPQALFDQVVTALRAQGRKSVRDDPICGTPQCCYRFPQPDGTVLKCAAGHVLPDSLYQPSMERGTVIADRCKPVFESIVGEDNINLLSGLQRVHDSFQTYQWEDEWRRLAVTYGLTYTPPVAA